MGQDLKDGDVSIEAITYVKLLDLGELEGGNLRLLLYILAENTFNDSGLCKVGQQEIARQTRSSTRSVIRRLIALEDAKSPIIERIARYLPEGGRKTDAIKLCGFSEWLEEQQESKGKRRTPPLPDKLSGRGVQDDGLGDDLSASPTRHLLSPPTCQQLSPSNKNPVLDRTSFSPPTPSRGVRVWKEIQLLKELKAEGGDAKIIERFLEPVLYQCPLIYTPNPIYALRYLCEGFADLSDEQLETAARRVLETRKAKVKIADLRDALIEARRSAGEKVIVAKTQDPEAHEAWLGYYRARVATPALCTEQDKLYVKLLEDGPVPLPSRLPPSLGGESLPEVRPPQFGTFTQRLAEEQGFELPLPDQSAPKRSAS
jgi:hypothetical protein